MAERETAESILKFFTELDPGEEAKDDEYEINYASPAVVRKGIEAAKMLMAIRQILGAQAAKAASDGKENGAAKDAEMKATLDTARKALSESETEVDRLLTQNLEIKEENEQLKVKINRLQKQVERLYSRSELGSILNRISDEKPKEDETPKSEPEPPKAPPKEPAKEKAIELGPPPEAKTQEKPEPTPAATPAPEPVKPAPDEEPFHESELMDAARVPESERKPKERAKDPTKKD